MKPLLVALLATAVLAVAPAQAATPVRGGSYDGRTSQGAKYNILLRVGNTGTRISRFSFNWRAAVCGLATNGAQGRVAGEVIPIAGGRFEKIGRYGSKVPASKNFGGGTQTADYRIVGRFTGANRARGTVRVTATIRNRAGLVIDTCRMTRAATFRADRVGVTDPGDSLYAIGG